MYSANQQSKAAKGAANASQRAADAATQEQARQYDQSREDMLPWLNTGEAALNRLASIYGLGTSAPAATPSASAPSNGVGNVGYEVARPYTGAGNALAAATSTPVSGGNDYSSFFDSPDYQYALGQGINALDRSAAARGRLYSGGYGQDLTKYAEGMATQNLGNYLNRLSAIAGTGQTASNNLANLGQSYATNVGNIGINNANNMATSYQQSANANSQMAGAIGGAFNNWYQNNSARNGGGSGWYLGSKPGAG